MDEARYLLSLEFRLCGEFAGMTDLYLRYLWCDGFTPQQYLLDDPVPRITGRVWICNGPKRAEWKFTLFLPHPVRSREAIDWAKLVPAEKVTQWLAVDRRRELIEIEPSAAVPDFA